MWDPDRYLTYADQRGRPFSDLLARIDIDDPAEVIDLGSGPGNLTITLAERWPEAHIVGVDSSSEMIAKASEYVGIDWVEADLLTWRPPRRADVVISNAALQWVPDHLAEMPRLAGFVAPGGWFAFQVPGNFGEPSHVLLREAMAAPRWRERLSRLIRPGSHEPVDYLDALIAGGLLAVDVWETTYYHVLTGDDPVFTWVSGTALRPIMAALDATEREAFLEPYAAALREAYPPRDDGSVILPFRRIFGVARGPR